MRPFRVPLVWANLMHDRRRLLVAIGGIGFAVLLIFMETGFQNALFDSTIAVLVDLNADLVIASRSHYAVHCSERFDQRRLDQARACPGVAAVEPLFLDIYSGIWTGPQCVGHPIRVLACDPEHAVFEPEEIRRQTSLLKEPGTALFDVKAKSKYGVPRDPAEVRRQTGIELSDRALRLVGAFQMGTDFISDGTIITSAQSFARYFPHRAGFADPLSVIDLGVVRVAPGCDVRTVQQQLNRLLPADVVAHTKQEIIQREIDFWNEAAPIGYIFFIGTLVGFLVGVIICYQVIYSDIADHLAEFATLKAMGYRNRYFVAFVLKEAVCLSILSFAPGCLVAGALYFGLARYTGLLMLMTAPRVAKVFVLTTLMCVVSGSLAMRKVYAADPADLY